MFLTVGKRLFVSGKGYVGWVDDGARSGDIICVSDEATVPYVLRTQGDGSYKLVGECYLYGVMEGQVLRMQGFQWKDCVLT